MSLDRSTVKSIAYLARLRVEDAQCDALAVELSGILHWVEQLAEVDTEGVEPMTSVAAMTLTQRVELGDRWRQPGRRPVERAVTGRRLLRGAEGRRMTGGLTRLTIASARDRLAAGRFSAVELTRAHLDAIADARPLNAFITETPELALARAAESDARRAKGDTLGPLDGIPLAIKDLFCTEGVRTTAGSHILDGFIPTYELTVTAKLRAAGAVMLGKTNLDEFAMGSSNTTSFFGPVKNPWGPKDGKDLVPGGSSGGSAAAVAAGLCLGATGTDTGGSIRQPASFCGIVGIKPTYGRCSRWGIVAFASSLDQAGPMTRSVRDAAILLSGMAGHDPKDSTSAPMAVPDFEAAVSLGVRGLKVGIPREYRIDGMAAEIDDLWRQGEAWLREAGAEIRDVSLPHTRYALATYYIIAPAEASSNLARYDGVRFGLRVPGDNARRDVHEHPRRRLRRRGAPAHPYRHLRAVGRLLRRLLPEGAKGPSLDRRRFRPRLRGCRRDPDANRAVRRVRHRRQDGRSDHDVSQ